jgi:hypothetical protein
MAEPSSRRGVLIGLGVLSIVAGLVAAVAMWNIGGGRRRDAVEGFARAPVGCDTTLDFVETGEYFVFIERAGRLDGIRGDCDVEGAYDVGSATPDVDITIVDPDGAPVDLDRTVTDLDYSEAGFVGAAAFTIEITQTNDHVVRVESPDNEAFVIAVGRDPSDGVAVLRGGALALGILGLLLGGGLILLGARRSNATVAAPQWAPGAFAPPPPFTPGQGPQGPPVYGQQSGPPQFVQPQPPGRPPQYGQPQPPQPPQYGQPQAPHAYGRPQQAQPPPPRPAGPASVPGQPSLPGQPGWGPASPPSPPPPNAQHPAAGDPPIEWAPQGSENTEDRPPPPPAPS